VTDLAEEINAVGWTAFGVAWTRARESVRADRLFDDPLAAEFVAAVAPHAPTEIPPIDGPEQDGFLHLLADFIAIRTRFFDDYFAEAAKAGVRQMVILAAGLDARAYRLDWPAGTTAFEVDQPVMLRFKQRVLHASGQRPTCERVTVGADLREDWLPPLRAAGLRTDEPIAWSVEGLLPYLGDDGAQRLLRELTAASAEGSRLATEHVRMDLSELPMFAEAAQGIDAAPKRLWPGDLAAEPAEWLTGEGWRAHASDPAGLAVQYGRKVPRVLDPAFGGAPYSVLVSSTR
jgi:methyltransferase (TIGR00027 family)